MCSERYAADIPLRFLNTQLPPTRSDFSKQSNVEAALVQRLRRGDAGRAGADHAGRGERGHAAQAVQDDACVKFVRGCEDAAHGDRSRGGGGQGVGRRGLAARGRAGSRSRSCTARATTTGRCPRASSTPARAGRRPPCARSRRRSGCAAGSGASCRRRRTGPQGPRKVVRYWMMEPRDGEFVPNDEVDEMRWLPAAERAPTLLSYTHDRELVREVPDEPRAIPRAWPTAGRGSTGPAGTQMVDAAIDAMADWMRSGRTANEGGEFAPARADRRGGRVHARERRRAARRRSARRRVRAEHDRDDDALLGRRRPRRWARRRDRLHAARPRRERAAVADRRRARRARPCASPSPSRTRSSCPPRRSRPC